MQRWQKGALCLSLCTSAWQCKYTQLDTSNTSSNEEKSSAHLNSGFAKEIGWTTLSWEHPPTNTLVSSRWKGWGGPVAFQAAYQVAQWSDEGHQPRWTLSHMPVSGRRQKPPPGPCDKASRGNVFPLVLAMGFGGSLALKQLPNEICPTIIFTTTQNTQVVLEVLEEWLLSGQN